jgi:hypothetical protein
LPDRNCAADRHKSKLCPGLIDYWQGAKRLRPLYQEIHAAWRSGFDNIIGGVAGLSFLALVKSEKRFALCLERTTGDARCSGQIGGRQRGASRPLADLAIAKDYGLHEAHLCRAAALRGLHQPGDETEQTIADCLAGKE